MNAFTIRKSTHFVVQIKNYKPQFIIHILKYVINNLKKISLDERDKFSIKFVLLFVSGITKQCVFIIPTFKALDDCKNRLVSLRVRRSNNNINSSTADNSSFVELVKTPERVATEVRMFKEERKKRYVEEVGVDSVVMKSNSSHQVPSHVDQLFDPSQYIVYDNKHQEEEVDTEENAEAIIVTTCTQFVESVMILEDYWFFVTSLCVFVHNKKVDDCADSSPVGMLDKAVALIKKKDKHQDR